MISLFAVASSNLLLAGFLGLLVLAGLCFQIGWLGKVIDLSTRWMNACVDGGFAWWRRLLSWAPWPVFAAMVVGLHVGGLMEGPAPSARAILAGLTLLFFGAIACLAYLHIDVERQEVSRGYKTLSDPQMGQAMAANLVFYGRRIGLPLMLTATLATVGGFALLNQGLFQTIGADWFDLKKSTTDLDEPAPDFVDFLAYTLINLFRLVDLLDIANSYNFAHITYVRQARWPASTLLMVFKTFFTFVLLQQIYSAVRHFKVLGETIQDFWSPHPPIHQRAGAVLALYGTNGIAPLLASLRRVETLVAEQRASIPRLLAGMGAAAEPTLLKFLKDPDEKVRAVAVSALGQIHAVGALPRFRPLTKDASEWVRQALVEALGTICDPESKGGRQKRLRSRILHPADGWRRVWLVWRPRSSLPPLTAAVELLSDLLQDPLPSVRAQAVMALKGVGVAAAPAQAALLPLLHDVDEAVRCKTAQALSAITDQPAAVVSALQTLLRDPSPLVRQGSCEALGNLKAAAAAAGPALIPLLQDADEAVRQAAATALKQIGSLDDAATPELVQGLTSQDNVVRARTAEALGAIGPSAASTVPELIRAAQDDSGAVRAKAVEALGKMGTAASAASAVLLIALHDEDFHVCALAAAALSELGPQAAEAIPALIQALGHMNAEVRAQAARALAHIGPAEETVHAALVHAAQDAEGLVRAQAVLGLGQMKMAAGLEEALRTALGDPDPQVRISAVQAFRGQANVSQAALQDLTGALEDGNDQVKVEATLTLPGLAPPTPSLLEGLSRLLQDDTEAVRLAAAQALGKLGPAAQDAGEHLARGLATAEAPLRENIVRALALILPPQAVSAFLASLKDPVTEIRKIASAGLMKIADLPPEAHEQLIEALKDPDVQVQANIAHLLGKIAPLPPAAIPFLLEGTTHVDDGVRRNSAHALAAADPATIAPVMERLLTDNQGKVRVLAAQVLLRGQPDHVKALDVLLDALTDATPRVRQLARSEFEGLALDLTLLHQAGQERLARTADPEVRAELNEFMQRWQPPFQNPPSGAPASLPTPTHVEVGLSE